MIANFMLHYDALFILSNDVTIGESQPVSQANEREQQTQKHSNQQVAGNPLRGRFTTEGNSTAARRAVRSFDSCCGSLGDQEMLLSINFDGKSIFQRILEQYAAVASNK